MITVKIKSWRWLLLIAAMLFSALSVPRSVARAAPLHTTSPDSRAMTGVSAERQTIVRPLQQVRDQKHRPNRCGAVYRVRPGDTVRTIAKKCGVSIWRLRFLNRLQRSRLLPGQILRLKKARPPRRVKPTPTPTRKEILPTPVYYRKK